MNLNTLFDLIANRITKAQAEDKLTKEQSLVCAKYGDEFTKMYKAYKTQRNPAAVTFARHWMGWLIGTHIVSEDELKALPPSEQKMLGIITAGMKKADRQVDEGRWFVLDGDVRASGSARVHAYGASSISLHDEATAFLYAFSRCTAQSGWVFAFGESYVHFKGRGVAEMYDSSKIQAHGDIIVYTHDKSVLMPNSKAFHLDKRVSKFAQPDGLQ